MGRVEQIGDCVVPVPMVCYSMDRNNSYLIGNTFAEGSGPNETSFQKGHRPWNKGKRGLHLSPETEFKKGCKSNRILPVGTETIRKCKNGKRRAFVKIANPSVWRERAKVVWEAVNGILPAGYVVHHQDRDELNDDPFNLIAMTRAEHINEHRAELIAAKPVQEGMDI